MHGIITQNKKLIKTIYNHAQREADFVTPEDYGRQKDIFNGWDGFCPEGRQRN